MLNGKFGLIALIHTVFQQQNHFQQRSEVSYRQKWAKPVSH